MTRKWRKEQSEGSNYLINLRADANQGWHNHPTIAERYCERQLGLLVYCRIRPSRDDVMPGVFCAYVERVEDKVVGVRNRAIIRSVAAQHSGDRGNETELKSPVFVCVGEPLQQGKGVRWRSIPSVVRLKTLDHRLVERMQIGDLVSPETFGFGGDGEFGITPGLSGFPLRLRSKIASSHAKWLRAARKFLQSIGGNEHPTVRDLGQSDYLDAHGLRLRIELRAECYGYTLLGAGAEFGFERFQMFVCPTNLSSTPT